MTVFPFKVAFVWAGSHQLHSVAHSVSVLRKLLTLHLTGLLGHASILGEF